MSSNRCLSHEIDGVTVTMSQACHSCFYGVPCDNQNCECCKDLMCKKCACTKNNLSEKCIKDGGCYWIELDLCSSCL